MTESAQDDGFRRAGVLERASDAVVSMPQAVGAQADFPDSLEPQGYPVPLVQVRRRVGSWQFEVGEEAKKLLVAFGNRPVLVCALCGAHKTGKSFLAGLLAGHCPGQPQLAAVGLDLDHDGKIDTIEVGPDSNADGVPDALGALDALQAQTVAGPNFLSRSGAGAGEPGLWMTPARDKAGGKDVLLLDCQGLRGPGADLDRDAKLVAICLLLSSVLLVNVKCVISEGVLRELGLYCQLSKHLAQLTGGGAAAEAMGKPALMLVLRDFALDLQSLDGSALEPDDYLEVLLSSTSSAESSERSRMAREVRDQICQTFPSRRCTTLVQPADEEDTLQQLPELKYDSLRPEFRTQVKHAQTLMMRLLNVVGPKKNGGALAGGATLASLLTELVEALNSGKAMDIQDAWASTARKACSDLVVRLRALGENELESLCSDQVLPMADEDLSNLLKRNRENLRANFEANSLGDAAIREETWNELAGSLQERETAVEQLNAKLADERLRSAVADLENWLGEGAPSSPNGAEDPRGSALGTLIGKGLPYEPLARWTETLVDKVRSLRLQLLPLASRPLSQPGSARQSAATEHRSAQQSNASRASGVPAASPTEPRSAQQSTASRASGVTAGSPTEPRSAQQSNASRASGVPAASSIEPRSAQQSKASSVSGVPAASPVREVPVAAGEAEDDGWIVKASTTLSEPVPVGAERLPVESKEGFGIGDTVTITGPDGTSETRTVKGFGSIILDRPLTNSYPAGASIHSRVRKEDHALAAADPSTNLSGEKITEVAALAAADPSTNLSRENIDEVADVEVLEEPEPQRSRCSNGWLSCLCCRSCCGRAPASPRRADAPVPATPYEDPPYEEPVYEDPALAPGQREVVAEEDDWPLGMIFSSLPPDVTTLDSVDRGGWAHRVGLCPGTVVVAANGERLSTMSAGRFNEHLSRALLSQRPLKLIVEDGPQLGPSPEELMEEQQEAVRDVMINRSPPSEQDQVVARDVAGSEPVWEQDGAVTLTFQPGNVGLNYDRQTGIVGQVREGGQSGQSGVQPGWYIDLVEGSPYEPNMLQWLIDGCTPYKITFRKDAVTISMVFADLDYERLSANDAVKYRLEKALLEAASQVFAAYGQVALRFTGDPVLRARMYLLPRGLDFEELLAKLRAPEMSGEIAKTAANVEGVVALCDQDTELPDSLRVEQLVVTYGDVRSPEAFTLPDAEVPLTQQARQARRTSSDSTLSEAFLEGPPLPPPSEPPALGKEGEELPLDGEPAREDSALRNEEGAVVQLGDPAEGCGHLYYCGRQLGRGIIPDSDGRCGPYDGPQCPSCARLQKAMEDMFLHGVGAPDCTREVEQH